MPGKYDYELTQEQREKLNQIINDKDAPATKVERARALLLMDKGTSDATPKTVKEVSEKTGLSLAILGNLRKKLALEGLDAVLAQEDSSFASKPNKQPESTKQPVVEGETLIASQKNADGTNEWELKLTPHGVVLTYPGEQYMPRKRKRRKK